MKNRKLYYSTGEFARLNGMNKRTLHYYDEIGLFSPKYKAENGYRYYTALQTVQLELITTLRKMGLSIEEILRYQKSPADAAFGEMIADKIDLIDQSILELQSTKAFLMQKAEKLALSLTARHGRVDMITLPQQRILLSAPITGAYDDDDFSVAAEFSLRLKSIFGLHDNFGSRILADNILNGNYQDYDCFFAYGRPDREVCDELRPAGTFLRAFCIGGWESLREVYRIICSYARDHQLELYGYAYEEGLNEMVLADRGDYITMITAACRKVPL